MYIALSLVVLLTVALFYLVRLYLRQDKLVFRPTRSTARDPSQYGFPFCDLQLALSDGSRVRSWWIPNAESNQAVIFFHGSDGNITHELPTVQFLYSLPVNVLVVEYPGYEMNGVRPSERGCYLAAEAAWHFLIQEKGFDSNRAILYGQSLGGAVATYLCASHASCGGLVIQSGFTSVPDLAAYIYPYLPVRVFCYTRMDSLQRIAHCTCPLLIIHSQEDEHIPIQQAQRLFHHALSAKKFVTIRGLHSGFRWQLRPEIRAAWLELLRGEVQIWE
jgi:pimeloyl-ACP methyl ester carboxylesterase